MNIVIYTNILTPYRKYFFDLMNRECKRRGYKFSVLVMASSEPGRSWTYDQYKTEYTSLLTVKTFSRGEMHIHINFGLLQAIRKLKPNIVICAGSYICPGILTVLRNKKRLNYLVYFWSESHFNETRKYSSIKLFVRESIRKEIYSRFDGFWYAGKLSLELIDRYKKEGSRIIFVPNLIDESIFENKGQIISDETKKKYHIPLNKKVLFCPARLVWVKGIIEFIDIYKKVNGQEETVIVVAGDGELKQRIRRKASESNVQLILLGEKSQREIVELYQVSDFFLLPSLSDANPLTCVEALWEGLPLIISKNVGNYPEVVENGVNGVVFDYNEIDSAVTMISNMINTGAEAMTTARNTSLKIATSLYDSQKAVRRILDELSLYNYRGVT